MIELNQAALDNNTLPSTIIKADYDRKKIKAGIMHFGVGAFHRSHQAVYLDQAIAVSQQKSGEKGEEGWGLIGVGILPFDIPMRDAMKVQDCLYTVNEYSPNGSLNTRLIQGMVDYMYAPDNWDAVISRMVDPSIKIISLTITEGGYLIDSHGIFQVDHPSVVKDLASPHEPRSAFGLIIEALHRRRTAGTTPFTVMSCDNLRHNGDQARKACIAFAYARDAELGAWIEQHVTFPNGMVDRITPAMDSSLRAKLNETTGVHDRAPVVCEDFIQWVLEDNFVNGRPPFEATGVMMTSNVTPYEEAKIRLLNASHQMLSYPAYLSGERKVDEVCTNPLFREFLADFLNKDASPFLKPVDGMDLEAYKVALLQRFSNNAIGDQVGRLCLDGGSKIPGFLLATLTANLQASGRCARIAYMLACYNHYIHAKVDDNGEAYEVREPNAMALLEPIIASSSPMALIECRQLVGEASTYPLFVKDYLTCCDNIQQHGARRTLQNLSTILSA